MNPIIRRRIRGVGKARSFFPFTLLFPLLFSHGLFAQTPTAAADSDASPVFSSQKPKKARLSATAQMRSQALQNLVLGIFAEQENGPDEALPHYERALDADPSLFGLASSVAQELVRRGEFPQAISRLKDAARANPTSPLLEINLAEIYLFHLGKPQIAERHAQRALQLAPNSFAPRALLWEIATRQKQPRKAEEILQTAAQLETDNPQFWIQLAEIHLRFSEQQLQKKTVRQRILHVLEKAYSLSLEKPKLLSKIGDLYFLFGDSEKAIECYELARGQSPNLPLIRERIANALLLTPRAQEAAPLLRELFRENPQDLLLCERIIGLATERADWEEALLFHQKALALAPPNPERYLQIARIALNLGKYELARFYLQDAIERFPNALLFRYLLAVTSSRLKEYKQAMELFAFLENSLFQGVLPIQVSEFYYEYGNAALRAGFADQGVELLQKVIETNSPFSAAAANDLGYFWVERGENFEEAEKLIRKALDAEPRNGAYLDSLGWWYYHQGEYAQALSLLLQALDALESLDPDVLEHIGDTYRALGNLSQAMVYWQKSRQINPQNEKLQKKIGDAELQFLEAEENPSLSFSEFTFSNKKS